MPPLLCGSPAILDQSFPRNEEELLLISEALGEIQHYVETNKAHLVLTLGLRELVEDFDWSPPRPYILLNEIFRLLNQWFLQPNSSLIQVDVSLVENYCQHPVVIGTPNEGLVELWSEEIGKLLVLHDKNCTKNEYYIGVASETAFAGEQVQKYVEHAHSRVFPLIGPNTLEELVDAYDWVIPPNIHKKSVPFRSALKNCGALGAFRVDRPSSGSHYKAHFKGRRPWILDPNDDPVPNRYLRELIDITNLPLPVIKVALIEGRLPPRNLKLSKFTV